jgi:hypothetical protein
MVEGGSALLGTLLAGRLFDQVALFRAPLLLGGRDSIPAFGGPNPRRIGDALRLTAANPYTRDARRGPGLPAPELCEVWYPAGGRKRTAVHEHVTRAPARERE